MHNIHSHILLSIKKIFPLLVFILLCTNSFAQDGADSLTVADTVVAPSPGYESDTVETAHKFDSLATYAIPSYQPYEIADSVLQNLKKDEAFWYVNQTPKRQKPVAIDPNRKYTKPFYLQNWFRTLVWIIIIGAFLAVLIWFLIASDVRLFRKKPKAVLSEADIALTEDIFAVNYDEQLANAITNENYRLGVRLMYLHVLRLFAERSIIQYKIERTNSEYLFQLYNSAYYKEFFRLTRNFEYVWYGKFDISVPAFEMIRQDYTNLKTRL